MGFKKIVCQAERGADYNGYYTWPRLGYDARLDDAPDLRYPLPKQFRGATHVSDLMKTPAGRNWWKQNGTTVENATFDLAQGSLSRTTLAAYLKEKKYDIHKARARFRLRKYNPNHDAHGRFGTGDGADKPDAEPRGATRPGDTPRLSESIVADTDNMTPKQQAAVADALEVINSVHSNGGLYGPLSILDDTDRLTAAGNAADYIGGDISFRRGLLSPRATLTHEIGHAIDLYGPGDKYNVSQAETSPEFEDYRQAVNASASIQRLARLADPYTKTDNGAPISKGMVDYLRSGRETWARAYAQYVATRSQDETMIKELRHNMDVDRRAQGAYMPRQWEPRDFEPIAAAIDKVFKARGWIK